MKTIKLPFCKICLKTGLLCSACQEKIKKGLYKEKDLEISRKILEFAEKEKGLTEVEYKKSIERNGVLVLVFRRGSLDKLMSSGGIKLIKTLEKEFKQEIRVIEEGNRQEIIRNLIPATIKSYNTIYYPGELTVLNIKVDPQGYKRIKSKKDAYESLIREIVGISYVQISA